MKKLLFVLLLASVGCTDANMRQWTSIGDKAKVTCYSGGVVIYSGYSTGKVATENQSDGWYFEDSTTGDLVRASGDCVIRN